MTKKRQSFRNLAMRSVLGPRNFDSIRSRYPGFMAGELSIDEDLGKFDPVGSAWRKAKKIGSGIDKRLTKNKMYNAITTRARKVGSGIDKTLLRNRSYAKMRSGMSRILSSEVSLDLDEEFFGDDLGKIDIWGKIKKGAKAVGSVAMKIVKNPAVLGIISKAVSFIPGVGPLVSTALDGATKLLSKIPGMSSVGNIAKAMDELKKTGLQNVATGQVVQLSPDAQKVAEALKQVATANPSIQATDIVKGVVEDVNKGLKPAQIENEIKKDIQEKVQEQVKQNIETKAVEQYKQETGETPTPEQIQETKKEYSLFLDLGRDEPTPESKFVQARENTKLMFDKTLTYMNDTNIVIRDRLKKVDNNLYTRLIGIMRTIYTDLRQLYKTAYGKDIPLIYQMKEAFLGADTKKTTTPAKAPVLVKGENTKVSAKISVDQALQINALTQKNLQDIYNRISQVSKTVDDFFIKGVSPGNVPISVTGTGAGSGGITPEGSITPSYDTIQAREKLQVKQSGKGPSTFPSWIVPVAILGVAGVGAFMILKGKKFKFKRSRKAE